MSPVACWRFDCLHSFSMMAEQTCGLIIIIIFIEQVNTHKQLLLWSSCRGSSLHQRVFDHYSLSHIPKYSYNKRNTIIFDPWHIYIFIYIHIWLPAEKSQFKLWCKPLNQTAAVPIATEERVGITTATETNDESGDHRPSFMSSFSTKTKTINHIDHPAFCVTVWNLRYSIWPWFP